MKNALCLIVLLAPASQPVALAQGTAPSNSLARAQASFAAADTNRDFKLSVEEGKIIPLTSEAFLAQDQDKDGFWSKDEFLLFYRQRLVRDGQPVGADLEAEVARVQALRHAKEVEEARKRTQDEARSNPAASAEDQVDARLRRALEDLDKRAATGQATREDFQRTRNLLITSARAAATGGADASGEAVLRGETYRKMVQSLDRLEKAAADGQYSREEYQALREMMVRRARAIQVGQGGNGEGTPPPPTDAASIQAGLQNALEILEMRAAAGGATREDFQRVRDLMVARARAAANSTGATGPGNEGSPGFDTYIKMLQSLERLERMAGEGRYTKEEYQALREMVVRRARAIETEKTGAGAEPGSPAPADSANIQAGLQSALENLEKRAAAGGATREDFQRVRDLLIARARAAAGSSPEASASAEGGQSSETHRKLMQSLDRLEKAAAAGQYSKEEYQELRDQMIHRARVIETSANGPAAGRQKSAESQGGSGAPRDPQSKPESASREPTPSRPKPASETPGGGDNAKRPAPQPAPQPQRPPENKPEREKEKPPPPPQRPPQNPPS